MRDKHQKDKQASKDRQDKKLNRRSAVNATEAKALKKLLEEKGINSHSESYDEVSKNEIDATQQKDNTTSNVTSTKTEYSETTYNKLSESEILSTEKAGLVLLHPFLSTLFKDTISKCQK